jgi:hypothetical protein
MYWAFLARHTERLADNPRMNVPLAAVRARAATLRQRDTEVFEHVSAALTAGHALTPASVPAPSPPAQPRARRSPRRVPRAG